MKEERLRAEQAEATFQPKLDARSERLAAARRPPGKEISDVLIDAQAQYSARRAAAARAKEALEVSYSYQPKLTARGRRSTANTRDRGNAAPPHAHGEAGEDHGDSQASAQNGGLPHAQPPTRSRPTPRPSEEVELEQHCTFQPQLNHYAGSVCRIDCHNPHCSAQNARVVAEYTGDGNSVRASIKGKAGKGTMIAARHPAIRGGGERRGYGYVGSYAAQNAYTAARDAAADFEADGSPRGRQHTAVASWGQYAPASEGAASLSEADLARELQGEIKIEVTHMHGRPAAGGADPSSGGSSARAARTTKAAAPRSGGSDCMSVSSSTTSRSSPRDSTRDLAAELARVAKPAGGADASPATGSGASPASRGQGSGKHSGGKRQAEETGAPYSDMTQMH